MPPQVLDPARRDDELEEEVEDEQGPDRVRQQLEPRPEPVRELDHQQDEPREGQHGHGDPQRGVDVTQELPALLGDGTPDVDLGFPSPRYRLLLALPLVPVAAHHPDLLASSSALSVREEPVGQASDGGGDSG